MSDELINNETVAKSVVEQSPAEQPATISTLPESFQDDASLKDFKSVEDLAKSYKSMSTMMGSSLRIPSEDTGDDQKAEFYEKLSKVPGIAVLPNEDDTDSMDKFLRSVGKGRPESGEHYTLEGMPSDEPYSKAFREFAYTSGLTQDQAENAAKFNEKMEADEIEAMGQHGLEKLKEVWGADYATRLQGANAAFNLYKDKYPEAMESLASSPHINNPAIVAAFSEIASSMKEHGVAGMLTSPAYGKTPEEAQMSIEDIMQNKDHAYYNANDPNHEAAVQRMQKYHEIANPDLK